MIIFAHELRRGKRMLIIWSGVLAVMIIVCMALYPEMKEQMKGVNELFSNMGFFTAAFGLDQINFGEVMGFYAIECGNILGLGGAFYAALLGIQALAKEETEHTAEFLLCHPVTRVSVAVQKWAAAGIQLMIMNAFAAVVAVISFWSIGEAVNMKAFGLMHIAFLLMQMEVMSVCFGLSAFLRENTAGVGLGLAVVLYFLNIVRNISSQADFFKYITPFSYADASDITARLRIDGQLAVLGILYAVLGISAALLYYRKKDISA